MVLRREKVTVSPSVGRESDGNLTGITRQNLADQTVLTVVIRF